MNIKINNLEVSYKKKGEKVLSIDKLHLKNKDFIAVIGPSGSGKSTLLKTLLSATNILKGTLFIDDFDIKKMTKKNLKHYRQSAAYLSQESNMLLDDNVYTNLKRIFKNSNNFFLKLINYVTKKDMDNFVKALKRVDMERYLFTKAEELSGGQLQRIEICKVLLQKPKLILADEPNSSLDIKNSFVVVEELKKLASENNSITLINIHDLTLLRHKKIFTRILFVLNGSLQEDIPIEKWDYQKYKAFF